MCVMASLLCATSVAWSQERNAPPPPAPGDEPAALPAPADGNSPSDQRPQLNGRTTRNYAGQGPSKQAPHQAPMQAPSKQAPQQAPASEKQAPSAQAPEKQAPSAQAPMKGASYDGGGQPYTAGYAPCAGCQVNTAAAPTTRTYYPQNASRRGIFRGRYR
jgi:hypothetical protein